MHTSAPSQTGTKKWIKPIIVLVSVILLIFFIYRMAGSFLTNTDGNGHYSGFVVITDKAVFFEARKDSDLFSAGELLRINYQPENVLTDFPTDTVSTGDEIRMEIQRVENLIPRVAIVTGSEMIKAGSIDNIDPQNIKELEDNGYTIILNETAR